MNPFDDYARRHNEAGLRYLVPRPHALPEQQPGQSESEYRMVVEDFIGMRSLKLRHHEHLQGPFAPVPAPDGWPAERVDWFKKMQKEYTKRSAGRGSADVDVDVDVDIGFGPGSGL